MVCLNLQIIASDELNLGAISWYVGFRVVTIGWIALNFIKFKCFAGKCDRYIQWSILKLHFLLCFLKILNVIFRYHDYHLLSFWYLRYSACFISNMSNNMDCLTPLSVILIESLYSATWIKTWKLKVGRKMNKPSQLLVFDKLRVSIVYCLLLNDWLNIWMY